MPDWSYRTVLRPVLLSLGAERARRLAVRTLGTLSRFPFVVDFMGHMRADPRLRTQFGHVTLAGPVALGALVDPAGDAIGALERFGVGLIEVGPVAMQARGERRWRVDLHARAIEELSNGAVMPHARSRTASASTRPSSPSMT